MLVYMCLCGCPQLIHRDPEFRLGCSSGSVSPNQAVSEIKEHAFFSTTPMDPDEEVSLCFPLPPPMVQYEALFMVDI